MIVRSGQGGDFRDFARIEAWAGRIGEELTAGIAPAPGRRTL